MQTKLQIYINLFRFWILYLYSSYAVVCYKKEVDAGGIIDHNLEGASEKSALRNTTAHTKCQVAPHVVPV